ALRERMLEKLFNVTGPATTGIFKTVKASDKRLESWLSEVPTRLAVLMRDLQHVLRELGHMPAVIVSGDDRQPLEALSPKESKEYGHFTALKSLNLTVPAGTSLGFLGPNGAGKSTTIKIMTNLIRPSRGRAALFGIDVRQEPTHALARIGAVIETPEFYGYLSPLETLAYAGRLRGMSSKEIEHRSEAVLKV